MSVRNYSTGLRIYCADRKKMIQGCKNPITEGDLKWFLHVTVKVLNSYNLIIFSYTLYISSLCGRSR